MQQQQQAQAGGMDHSAAKRVRMSGPNGQPGNGMNQQDYQVQQAQQAAAAAAAAQQQQQQQQQQQMMFNNQQQGGFQQRY